MRLLAAILSIYILVLTVIPCCLYDNCEGEHTEQVGKQTTHHNNDDDTGCGTCSPFFCHSCSGCIITSIYYEPVLLFEPYKRVYNPFIVSFIPQYTPFLWQPPDIV